MRPIKFRAFNKTSKEISEINLLNEWFKFNNENYEIMQFTWLLDKNWKEIYEGDILKWQSGASNAKYDFFVTPEWNNNSSAFCIHDWPYWKRWSTKESNTADHLSAWHAVYNFEIIWNIYENSDLLSNPQSND